MIDNKVSVLQSQVALQVQTSQSIRLWHGRKPNYEKNCQVYWGCKIFYSLIKTYLSTQSKKI